MSIKLEDLFLSHARKILLLNGIWFPPKNYKNLHRIYMLSVMFTQYAFLLAEFIYIAGVWGDIEAVSESSYMLFTQASLCYKSTRFLIKKDSLIELLDIMESKTFSPQNSGHNRLLYHQSKRIKRLCLFFLTSACTTCTLWSLIPLFDEPGNRFFPFKIWMPVDPRYSPGYQVGYVYQIICIYISAMLFIGVDSIALCMIMFSCAELEIIMDKLKQIKPVPLFPKNEEKIELLAKNNNILEECLAQHQEVIRFIELVENAYHPSIFFQIGGTVAIICIICLRIVMVDTQSVQFFSMLSYLLTMLSQLFLLCWCGNEMTIRSQNLRDCFYLCPWHEQDNKFRKSLFIAMERMKRPIIFRAGRYIPLSRPTFVAVLRSSYSYFAVINQASKKENN